MEADHASIITSMMQKEKTHSDRNLDFDNTAQDTMH